MWCRHVVSDERYSLSLRTLTPEWTWVQPYAVQPAAFPSVVVCSGFGSFLWLCISDKLSNVKFILKGTNWDQTNCCSRAGIGPFWLVYRQNLSLLVGEKVWRSTAEMKRPCGCFCVRVSVRPSSEATSRLLLTVRPLTQLHVPLESYLTSSWSTCWVSMSMFPVLNVCTNVYWFWS